MPDYIANAQGHIDVPGVTATYPPGTVVTYINGAYAGHVSPILIEEEPTLEGTVESTESPLQGEQTEPPEHPSIPENVV